MRDPNEALAEARRRAAAAQDRGEYPAAVVGVERPGVYRASRQLARWAIVEPDRAQVYSTRRLGAPITAVKRVLLRLLRQYLDQVLAQQSRFNAHAAWYMLSLEDRVRDLEEEIERLRARAHAVEVERAAADRDRAGSA